MPALTDAGAQRAAARKAYAEAHPADSYTDRINSDRCITFGVPFIAAGYNGYFQIAQTAQNVAIMQEMAHETRIVSFDKRPHIDADVRQSIARIGPMTSGSPHSRSRSRLCWRIVQPKR